MVKDVTEQKIRLGILTRNPIQRQTFYVGHYIQDISQLQQSNAMIPSD